MSRAQSKKIFSKSQTLLVGGVNSPVRAFRGVGGNPLVISHGRGAKFFDVDGNGYTDYCLSWGSLILGHAHKDVVAAVTKAIKGGSSFGATTKAEVEIADFIVRHVPSIDMVRFVNSGTEATMSAIRLARGYTKRSKVIKFDGCYHGHVDDLLACAGSGVAFLSASTSEGIPAAHIQNTLSLPFNDCETFVNTLERHAHEIACVIVEPVPGNMGVVLPSLDFLKTLRLLTKKHGIVLIFDEVMSGFRGGLGGVQEDFGVIPDLTCMGKIIGGGFPIGAYGGRKDIMKHLSPLGGVYQAGTFSGTPVVMAAGLATLKNLNKDFYRRINTATLNFVNKTNDYFKAKNLSVHLVSYKTMVSIRFTDKPVHHYKEAQAASSDLKYGQLFHFLLSQGIYLPPADLESFFISEKHTQKDFNALQCALECFSQFNDKSP